MYDKQNANYGLYLAGMITEHQYYDLCEGKKAKKKVKETDILTPVSITRPPKGRFVK
jgi:hypothetical protein